MRADDEALMRAVRDGELARLACLFDGHHAANKLIQGSVNGGGPDMGIRSFNGDVYVRKGK